MAEFNAPGVSGSSAAGQFGTPETELRSTRETLRAGRDQAMDEARTAVRNMVEEQKVRAAQGLDTMAHALHETARTLGAENQDIPARYTNLAAEQLERASNLLRDRNWQDLVSEAERFARHQPTLFIGGAMAAGFLLARFLKSVPQGESASATGQSSYGMARTSYPGGAAYSGSTTMSGEG